MPQSPALPAGFVLDGQQAPPPPPGFTLDSEAPAPVTAMDRVGAVPSAFNAGVADVLGFPVDMAGNVLELLKAGVGSAYIATTGKAPPQALMPVEDRSNQFGSSAYIERALNRRGVQTQPSRPDDPLSRYLYAGTRMVPSAAAFGRVAGAPMGPSIAAGVAGGEASQATADAGFGPAGQAIAGMVGAAGPSAARAGAQGALRGAARGGEAGRMRTEQTIADFGRAGTTPSMGQATQSRGLQGIESLFAKVPGGAGVMANRGKAQAQEIGGNIERLANQLSPKASPEQAGRAIEKGVTGTGGFLETFKAKSSANYNALDKFVPKDTRVSVSNTEAALNQLAARIPGAEFTSAAFVNNRIASIRDALSADLSANQAGNNAAILRSQSQGLPYTALKQLRTIVGNELADAPFGGDVPVSQWKRLYAAMSSDMEAAAKASGPAAENALKKANAYHKAGMERIDLISSVIQKNGGPEAVFKAATSGAKEGATTLRAVMQSLPKDAQKVVSAGVLRRLGRAKPGTQNDTGDVFSTETFLTNWNTMSPQAKATLFDRYGQGFRQDMDAVAKVASNLREGSAVFKNPSGTGQAVGQMTAATTVLTSLLTGHLGVAGGVAAGIGASNISARFMTNPTSVKWLAKTTRAPQSALPALLAQAKNSSDPDLQELAGMFNE